MATPVCPFHIECQFHNSTTKSADYQRLEELFCLMRYEDCEIAQGILSGQKLPAGVCPDGRVRV